MRDFVLTYIVKPFKGKWWNGFLLLALWTVAFVALPAISGWFLAICSVVFVTANTGFSYLIPSAIIRLLSLLRTATRYFERLENHKTTLSVQQSLQLKIFRSVAGLPYFRKQVNNNSSLLENSTHGVDQILNHILLWLLPFSALLLTIGVYFIFLLVFSEVIAIEFIISSAIILFLIPQFTFRRNKILNGQLKAVREENHEALIQSFRGRIEISKYKLEDKAVSTHEKNRLQIERLDKKLQFNSFYMQLIVGLGFSYIAAFLLWSSGQQGLDAPLAIGIFFGIMAQAELSEMLFSGKSEKSSVEEQIKDMVSLFDEGSEPVKEVSINFPLEIIELTAIEAVIPGTPVRVGPVSVNIKKGEWVALYGKTGKGKSTLLNSLFYPEYRDNGSMTWNYEQELTHLPVPEAIYVTQKAYLLTGTLRENFEGYPDEEIERVLDIVDLTSWCTSLPDGLGSWIGENGETLSGGQRKKLLLAQALLKRPQLLVVDEPTAGISAENAIEIFNNIRLQYPGISILMATHMKEFERVVDKVIKI
ncbi:MAG: ATP-binding cassette domain-containing protein [Fermentimonas sp.]|nr:ATP-binding cassette domain-containing protein [Fermentimonas sp.]